MSEICRSHFVQGRSLIKAHDGYLIKTIGDSLMVSFRSGKDALDFAIEFRKQPGSDQIKIRAGIHVGPVQIEDEDAFGTMVNYAARVVGAAKGAEIFASSRAHSDIIQLGSKAHADIAWGQHVTDLKGFTGQQDLWEANSAKTMTPINP
jgi:class 3 adenylate cyclase